MGRYRQQRASRVLIGAMVFTVGAGAGTYYIRAHRKAKANKQEVAARTTTATPAAAAGADASAPHAPTALAATNPPPAAAPATPATPLHPTVASTVTVGGPTTAPTTRAAAVAPNEPVVLPAGASAALTEGKNKLDAGDLVGGRKTLNEALLSGGLSPDDARLAKQLMAEANQQIVFSQRRFANDPFEGTHTVQARENLQRIAASESVSWEFLGRINGLSDPRRLRAGATLKTIQGPFHAVVSKSAFTMDIYLGSPGQPGSMYVTTLPVGLGQNDSTPTGTWRAGGKLKNPAYFSPRGEGVIAADDPKNPLGEYWISLQGVDGQAVGKMSYGIHGTIDPSSIGKQSSMGCIRLRDADIALVYELLVEGKSTIVVKD